MKKIVKTIVFMWLALFTMSQVATAQTAQLCSTLTRERWQF